jgi:hypothetical protein
VGRKKSGECRGESKKCRGLNVEGQVKSGEGKQVASDKKPEPSGNKRIAKGRRGFKNHITPARSQGLGTDYPDTEFIEESREHEVFSQTLS